MQGHSVQTEHARHQEADDQAERSTKVISLHRSRRQDPPIIEIELWNHLTMLSSTLGCGPRTQPPKPGPSWRSGRSSIFADATRLGTSRTPSDVLEAVVPAAARLQRAQLDRRVELGSGTCSARASSSSGTVMYRTSIARVRSAASSNASLKDLIEQVGDTLSRQAAAARVTERVVGCGLALLVDPLRQTAAGPGPHGYRSLLAALSEELDDGGGAEAYLGAGSPTSSDTRAPVRIHCRRRSPRLVAPPAPSTGHSPVPSAAPAARGRHPRDPPLGRRGTAPGWGLGPTSPTSKGSMDTTGPSRP